MMPYFESKTLTILPSGLRPRTRAWGSSDSTAVANKRSAPCPPCSHSLFQCSCAASLPARVRVTLPQRCSAASASGPGESARSLTWEETGVQSSSVLAGTPKKQACGTAFDPSQLHERDATDSVVQSRILGWMFIMPMHCRENLLELSEDSQSRR